MSREQLLDNIRGLLYYHGTIGLDYPCSEDIVRFSEKGFSGKVPASRSASQPVREEKETAASKVTPAVVSVDEVNTESVADLEKEPCSDCPLRAKRLHLVQGRGQGAVRLMVVGDWLRQSAFAGSRQTVFGVEQDLMLARMVRKMQLPEEDVFVTNVLRCALPDDVEAGSEDVGRCVQFLYQQIERLQPEVLCLMGPVAARTVIGKRQSLSQLRGKFYHVKITENLTVPALATYHPDYLLKNKEMRWPAWEDLQKIASRLGIRFSG